MKVKVTNNGAATRVFYDSKMKATAVEAKQTVVADIPEALYERFRKRGGPLEVEALSSPKTGGDPESKPATITITEDFLDGTPASGDDIPEGWRDLPYTELKPIALKFTSGRVNNKAAAVAAVEAELARRG